MRYFFAMFIVIQGLLFMETPFVRGSSFRGLAQHVFDEFHKMNDGSVVQDGDIVFVKTEYLDEFVQTIHPEISTSYILITHNCDTPSPGAYAYLLDDPKLYHWFGQNQSISHHKFTGIPIGIANEIDSWGRPLKHGKTKSIQLVYDRLGEIGKKQKLVYFYFDPYTNSPVRVPVRLHFLKQSFCKWGRRRPYVAYLAYMAEHKYALSPPGNGLDCHRTWESLYMGVVPIVLQSTMDETLADLPVLIVKAWSDVTKEFLEQEYEKIWAKPMKKERMCWPYWKALVLAKQKACREE